MLRLVSFAKKETPLLGSKKEPTKVPRRPSFDAESGVFWNDGVLRSLQPGQRLAGPAMAADPLQLPVESAYNGRIQRPRARIPGGGDLAKGGIAEDAELADMGGEDEFVLVDALSPGVKLEPSGKRRSSGGLGERPQTAGNLRSSDLSEDENGWPANGRWIKTAEEEADDLRKDVDKLASQLAAKEQELAKALKQAAAAEAIASGLTAEKQELQGKISAAESELTSVRDCKQKLEQDVTAKSAQMIALSQRLTAAQEAARSEKIQEKLIGGAPTSAVEFDDLQAAAVAFQADYEKKEADIVRLHQKLRSAESQTSQLQAEVDSLKKDKQLLEKESKVLVERREEGKGTESKLRAEIDRLKVEVSLKAKDSSKAVAGIEQLRKDLQQKTQEGEQLSKELEQMRKDLAAQRKAGQDKDSKIEELKAELAGMDQGKEKLQAEVNVMKQQVESKGEEASRLEACLDETKRLASAVEEETGLLKTQLTGKDKKLAEQEEEIKSLKSKARDAEDASKLKLALQERDDQLKAYQVRLREVEDILVQLGYEKEGGKAQCSSAQEAAAEKNASLGRLSDLETAGKWVMKHCVTVEDLKKEHELAQKLSRREVLNLQQEVEELKMSLSEKDKLCTELKAKVSDAAKKDADGAKEGAVQELKRQATDETAKMEATKPGSPSPAWQQTVLKRDETVTSSLGVSKAAGEKVKATANVLMQKIATAKPGADAAASQDVPKETGLVSGTQASPQGAGKGKHEKENGLDLSLSDGAALKPVAEPTPAEALAAAAAAALERKAPAASGPGKKKKKGRGKH